MYLNIMKTTMTIITQTMDIPHPTYVTIESALDSDEEICKIQSLNIIHLCASVYNYLLPRKYM